MTIGELIEDDLAEARAEGKTDGKTEMILEVLCGKGSVSEETKGRILKERDSAILKEWICLAVQAESVQQFEEAIR